MKLTWQVVVLILGILSIVALNDIAVRAHKAKTVYRDCRKVLKTDPGFKYGFKGPSGEYEVCTERKEAPPNERL